MMLFARPGKFGPCGMFTKGHFELILITIIWITIALKNTMNKTKRRSRKNYKKMHNSDVGA